MVWRDLALVLLAPVLLHAPELLGWISTDPRLFNSQMAAGLRAGLTDGQPGFLDPNSAFTAQSLGHLAAEQWLHGIVPWWNALLGVGAPLAAEMQPAALFLPFVLLMHFAQGWLWLHILLEAIAGCGTYALLRSLGCCRSACLMAAALYGANGTFAWFSHGPERVAAFLPWMLLGVEWCRAGRFGAPVFAVALAWSIYAGFPETAYLDGLLALLWAAVRVRDGWRFAWRLGAGGVAGLLLAMPAVLPFALYAAGAAIGQHGDLRTAYLPGAGMATLLLPYVHGPMGAFGDPLRAIDGNIGGYVGTVALALGLSGLLNPGRDRWLRMALGGWVIACVARMAGFAPAVWVFGLVPLVGQTAFYRYIPPSLAMASAVLAGLAVDDWRRGTMRGQAVTAACVMAVLAAGICGGIGQHVVQALWHERLYRAFHIGSLVWAAGSIGAAWWLLRGRPTRGAALAMGLLVCADVAGLYSLARAPARLGGRIDPAPAVFLRDHAGLSRQMSLAGGVGLNEGAWDGFAAVEETMLPAPGLWADWLRRTLNKDAIVFLDEALTPRELARQWPAYRYLGVGWISAGRDLGPAHWLATAAAGDARAAVRLAPGVEQRGVVEGGLAGAEPGAAPVRSLGVEIGTFGGVADGVLRLTVWGEGFAASGTAPLAGARDNAPLDVALDGPVPVERRLNWAVVQERATRPAALWLFGGAPRLTGEWSVPGLSPRLVFRNVGTEIYAVPGALPYWLAEGCAVTPAGRERVAAECPGAASLLRRELFFDGWRASVNGVPAAIRRDGLFQRIDLPAGRAVVAFRYAPPFIGFAYAAGLAGLVIVLGLGLGWRGVR